MSRRGGYRAACQYDGGVALLLSHEAPLARVEQVIPGFEQRRDCDLQKLRELLTFKPAEAFRDVSWRRVGRISNLLAELALPRALWSRNELVDDDLQLFSIAARSKAR